MYMWDTGARLDQELLNLVLERLDLALKLRALVGGDRGSDHRARHAARAPEGLLRGNKHVWHVLVLTEKGKVEEDFERLSVSSHDNELRDTAVQGLGSLVSTLLELLVVTGLLHQLEDGHRQVGGGEGEGLGIDFGLQQNNNTGVSSPDIRTQLAPMLYVCVLYMHKARRLKPASWRP